MKQLLTFAVFCAIACPFSLIFGIIIERDRKERFPTKDEKLAKVITLPPPTTRAQRRRLRQNRADLRKALRR